MLREACFGIWISRFMIYVCTVVFWRYRCEWTSLRLEPLRSITRGGLCQRIYILLFAPQWQVNVKGGANLWEFWFSRLNGQENFLNCNVNCVWLSITIKIPRTLIYWKNCPMAKNSSGNWNLVGSYLSIPQDCLTAKNSLGYALWPSRPGQFFPLRKCRLSDR